MSTEPSAICLGRMFTVVPMGMNATLLVLVPPAPGETEDWLASTGKFTTLRMLTERLFSVSTRG